MTPDFLAVVVRTQLVASLAILALIALRRFSGPRLDPDTRIWLWTIPPLAACASLLPKEGLMRETGLAWAAAPGGVPAWAQGLVAVWLVGAGAALLRIALLHLAFLGDVKRGRAGPAVAGLACQRIVMPSELALEPVERALIRAHEWEHIRRGDVGVRNLLALVQCLFWFNPLIHMAASGLRLDQELACDEAVVRRLGRRRLYAETLLKCHAARPSPLGCHWLAGGAHPLETRLAALARRPATEARRTVATAFGLAAGLAAAVTAFAMTPEDPAHRRLVLHYEAAPATPPLPEGLTLPVLNAGPTGGR
jgi:beta-lactamase regulating signal transducer with metallopeptidase domain